MLDTEKDSTAEATGAVVAHVLSRPDSIRQRAQAAATISGALGVALVVGAITVLTKEGESFQPGTIVAVCAGIGGFALSVWLSVYAVVFPHDIRRQEATTAPISGGSRYQPLIKGYERYADEVRQKMRLAAAATAFALVATTAAVVLEIIERTDSKLMTLVVRPEAMPSVRSLCLQDGRPIGGGDAAQITGELREDQLGKDIVYVERWSVAKVPSREPLCDGTLALPSDSILAGKHDGR